MKKFFALISAVVVLSISAMAMAIDFDGEYIEVEGIVYPAGQSPNILRRIAIMDAYRILAEQIDTIYVTTNSTVRNMRDLDETINARVETALRGAKVIDVRREYDGSYHAIVRLYTNGVPSSLSSAVLGENIVIEDFPAPKVINIHSEIKYTGLIIDCRGHNLSTAIAPAIKSDDGTEIYAYKNIGYQTATDKGMVAYSTSVDSGVERAGDAPLMIKAVDVSGNCDVVVSAEDADRILASNQSANFLSNCAVVLVR